MFKELIENNKRRIIIGAKSAVHDISCNNQHQEQPYIQHGADCYSYRVRREAANTFIELGKNCAVISCIFGDVVLKTGNNCILAGVTFRGSGTVTLGDNVVITSTTIDMDNTDMQIGDNTVIDNSHLYCADCRPDKSAITIGRDSLWCTAVVSSVCRTAVFGARSVIVSPVVLYPMYRELAYKSSITISATINTTSHITSSFVCGDSCLIATSCWLVGMDIRIGENLRVLSAHNNNPNREPKIRIGSVESLMLGDACLLLDDTTYTNRSSTVVFPGEVVNNTSIGAGSTIVLKTNNCSLRGGKLKNKDTTDLKVDMNSLIIV